MIHILNVDWFEKMKTYGYVDHECKYKNFISEEEAIKTGSHKVSGI